MAVDTEDLVPGSVKTHFSGLFELFLFVLYPEI
jgi:hypothetical protein